MILQRLDAPSLAAARRTGRTLAAVGKRYLHTDDCFSKAMFRVHMSRLVTDMIAAALAVQEPESPEFFADEDLDALLAEMAGDEPSSPLAKPTTQWQPFTQLQAGKVLNRHLFVLTPTATGWIDPSGLVTFTRHGSTSVSFKAPGRPTQTGTLQPMGIPGIDTYSAWLQQVVHCRMAASPDAQGQWDHVVPPVFPFVEGPNRGREAAPCHVIQLTSGNESAFQRETPFVPGPEWPFFNTLWRQIHDRNQDLFEDEEGRHSASDVLLTDADVVGILFQVVHLLADLYIQPVLTRGVRFLSLNNTSDIAVARDADGRPLARMTNFNEACIELTTKSNNSEAPQSVRVCQTWSSDRTVLHDVATFLTELHFIIRNTEAFPRTRGILRQMRVRTMYRVFGGHIQADSVRPISDLTLHYLVARLERENPFQRSLPVV
jgi:hypothetical protein